MGSKDKNCCKSENIKGKMFFESHTNLDVDLHKIINYTHPP